MEIIKWKYDHPEVNVTFRESYFKDAVSILMVAKSGQTKFEHNNYNDEFDTITDKDILDLLEWMYSCILKAEKDGKERIFVTVTIGYKSVDFCSYGERSE